MRKALFLLAALLAVLAVSCTEDARPATETEVAPVAATIATGAPAVELPKLQWTKADLQIGSYDGQQAILDTVTGEVLTLTELPTQLRHGTVRITDWNESGIYIRVEARVEGRVVEAAIFRAASPGASFERRESPAVEYEIRSLSGKFKLQFREDRGSEVIDGATGATIQTQQEALPGGFSADGAYLTLFAGGGERLFRWDGSRFADTGLDRVGIWSPVGHVLAYGFLRDPNNGAEVEVRLLDPATGDERSLGAGSPVAWSPDGRYLTVANPESLHQVAILDVQSGKQLIRASAARFAKWLSNDTFLYVADYCGESRFATLSVDGVDTPLPTDSPGIWGFSLSPDDSRLAYRALARSNAGQVTAFFRIHNLISGEVRTYETGPYVTTGYDLWSPDGRYLVLRIPAGKDGPCFMRREGNEVTTVEVFD